MIERLSYACLMVVIIILGLLSRQVSFLPAWLGDSLWAMTLYLALGLCWPKLSERRLAVLALLLAFAVEFSQLLQWQWLVTLRQTTMGHLLLGRGFLFSDLVAYTVGIDVIYWLMKGNADARNR